MSLTSKQIDKLRAYAKDRKGELAKMLTDAADTIELLSAKLHASQMERSSQYYHGGWIPCSERLPEEYGNYLITTHDGNVDIGTIDPKKKNVWSACDSDGFYWLREVLAWIPLPEPYREESEE